METHGVPNWIVPTPPVGDSSHRVADTEFVTGAIASAVAGAITTSAIASGLATTLASAFAGTTGFVLQTIYNETTTLFANTSTMQGNFTSIPVKTDGLQIITATITPTFTTTKLLIRAVAPMSSSSGNVLMMALFQDTTTSALAATVVGGPTAGVSVSNASLVYNMVSGTTGPTTFKINVANVSTVTSTWTVNAFANPVIGFFGGTLRATLVIQESRV